MTPGEILQQLLDEVKVEAESVAWVGFAGSTTDADGREWHQFGMQSTSETWYVAEDWA